jgi:hypothetical protein
MMAGVGRKEDAIEAVRQARAAAERPWWLKRFLRAVANVPFALWRGFVGFLRWLRDVLAEMTAELAVMALLALPLAVILLITILLAHV